MSKYKYFVPAVLTVIVFGFLSILDLSGQSLSTKPEAPAGSTWISDNGNGTFSNPLFYDEFSDPDVIRVGDDYYMTGTTISTAFKEVRLHSIGSMSANRNRVDSRSPFQLVNL